jgi:VCBS repeat-containing protein
VLANDADVDGNPLTAILVSGPSHGTLTLNANGSFSYTPEADYNGPDGFSYKSTDGIGESNDTTVSIAVTPVNDPPIANADIATVAQGGNVLINVLSNDSIEPDYGETLSITSVTQGAHGAVAIISGQVQYTPNASFVGSDAFNYTIGDGQGGSATATVTVSVTSSNQPPVAQNQSVTLNEDSSRAITLRATDPNGNPLVYNVVSQPANGRLTGIAPNVTYTPNANYNGPDSFTFRANDGMANSNVATVSLTVTAVNDAPVAQSASYSTRVMMPFVGQLGASDVEGSALTYSLVGGQPSKGVVLISPTNGQFVYIPLPGRTGTDSFRFRVSDGSAQSNTAKISVQIKR